MNYELSKTEMEIMRKLWKEGGEMTPRALLEFFHGNGKDWKRQTLTTMLTRMEEKGMVARKRCLVRAVVSEQEYQRQQSRKVVEEVFDGKLERFVAAFTGNTEISDEDVQTLEQLIEKLGRKEG